MRRTAVLVLASVPLHTFADPKAGEAKAQLCTFCHKVAPDKGFPPLLEQQPAEYLVAATTAYKTRQRVETSMNVNAANLSDTDIRDIADYFASKVLPVRSQDLDAAKIAAGQKLAGDMNCANCHGDRFRGSGLMPRLAGQNVMYLVGQMEAFRDGRRSLPNGMAVPKDRTEIENVASYLASLP